MKSLQSMDQTDKIKNNKRYEYIDALKILGCILVIYIHTLDRGYNRYAISFHTSSWIWDFFLADLSQAAVPLFLAISGSLLLGKEESIKQTYRRIPRFLFDLIFFSVIYICFETKSYGKAIVPVEILIRIIRENYLHLWYLYAHIALILTLPFLRPMVKGLTKKTGIYLLIISALFTAIISISGLFGISFRYRYHLVWTNMIIFIYPVEGYIINKLIDIDKISKKMMSLLILLSALCFIIDLLCGSYFLQNNPDTLNETFLVTFNIVKVAMLIIISKKVFNKLELSIRSQKMVSIVGQCTFGIYLIHMFILDRRPIKYLWWAIEDTSWGQYIGIYISCMGTFVIGFIVVYICRKIPLLKKMF